jgi:3-oxoacyl-[acyl-carrier protein] reductase
MRLSGRVALVTGSSRGIGAAIARRLSADGAKVVLHGKAEGDAIAGVAETIRAAGGVAAMVCGDLTTAEAPLRIVREAFAVHGALDILVCNAGGGGGGRVSDNDVQAIDRGLALNLRSVMLSTGEYARLTTSPHGRVIIISSGAASHGAPGVSIYAAAKAGAEAFGRSAAQELGERGITVNAVAPGATQTDMVEGGSWFDHVAPWAALRRTGRPDDIADIVAFLSSDEARWLTGVTLPASGGLITSAANIMARF